MKLNSTLILMSLLGTSLCIAKADHRDHKDNKLHTSAATAQQIHQLLKGAIDRNAAHARHVLKSRSQDGTAPKSAFDPILAKAQELLTSRLDQLSTVAEATPSISVDAEMANLGTFWSGLQTDSDLSLVASFCQAVFSNAQSSLNGATTDDAKAAVLANAWGEIGQAVFLAERYPQEMKTLINPSDLTTTAENLAQRCSSEMQGLITYCNNLAATQQKLGFQDPGLTMSMSQPKVMADALLTTYGKLNLGMVPLIRAAFVPQQSPLEYQVGMDRVLSCMNSTWQPLLDNIVASPTMSCTSKEMVRADLGVNFNTAVTDDHCKLAALKAILSQLNQGATGDCFAVAWAIKKHDEYLKQSLQDYAELIKNGYLTRSVNGTPDQFYFETSLADTDLLNPITLNTAGALSNGGNIWEAPGIIASCTAMGITDVQASTTSALANLSWNGSAALQTTAQDVIGAFAAYSVQCNSELYLTTQTNLGLYAFSITQNHVLRAWETSLAAMAEAKTGDYVRDTLNQSVQQALTNQWTTIKGGLPTAQQSLLAGLQQSFQDTLNAQCRFVYDAAIPLKQTSSDGSSTDGGFEFYKRDPKQPTALGTRVATPADFRSFLIDVVNMTAATMTPAFSTVKETQALSQITNSLISYMNQDTFLKDVFYAYDDANKSEPDPVANYQNLQNTPMTTLNGDSPYAVEGLDTGVSFLPDVKTITPQNPYALIKWILDLASWKEQTQNYLNDGVPYELDPATSPQHAFNIAFDDSDIKAFVLSNQTSDQWLQQNVINANAPIAEAQLDSSTKQTFTNNLSQWLNNEGPKLASNVVDQFNKALTTINRKKLTTQGYASLVLTTLNSMIQADASSAEQLTVVFDTIFLQSLPAATLQTLSQSALRFAETNWDESEKNLYFCVYFNPRTAALSFATITEDRQDLSPMDEYQWIDQQAWEVVPEDEPAGSSMTSKS